MNSENKKKIKEIVRKGYGQIARSGASGCSSSCCGDDAGAISKSVGYSDEEIKGVPEGANLGLGCGNPVALASLKEGEVVLDLGSGAGFDTFLAAERVGQKGKVIGVDMTEEMVKKARRNAEKTNVKNVEFRLGEIEALPLESNCVDIIISNCVINLSPEKEKVFSEAFRVLKGGGRLMVSDLVLVKELPAEIAASDEAYIDCISGASMKDEYLNYIQDAGFKEIEILGQSKFHLQGTNSYSPPDAIESISVRALKPMENHKG